MAKITLGSTGITTEQNAFGALPIQRVSAETAVRLLREAFRGGMTYFDTSRVYTDSEEKIGLAFGGGGIDRGEIFLATKTMSRTPEGIRADIETSLKMMKTDYVDVYQIHLAPVCYRPGDGTGIYECMEELKAEGKIRHIGITAHSIAVAEECAESGLYETLQFPFSYLSGEREKALVAKCAENNVGFICMKALAGGLINHSAAAAAYLAQYKVLPIWGIQHEWELKEFLSYIQEPPTLSGELEAVIAKDRAELTGDFCRSCGYCMPCPEGIMINQCARMSLLMRRAPHRPYLSEKWQAEMKKIENCRECGKCKEKCPYELDTPALLKKNYEDYKKILSGEIVL